LIETEQNYCPLKKLSSLHRNWPASRGVQIWWTFSRHHDGEQVVALEVWVFDAALQEWHMGGAGSGLRVRKLVSKKIHKIHANAWSAEKGAEG
jgi:hypothetical protein